MSIDYSKRPSGMSKREYAASILGGDKYDYGSSGNKSSSSSTSNQGFIFLKQNNPLWGKVKIGNTPYKLEDFGCLITDLSMLSYWYGKYLNPAHLAKKLKFNSNGEFLWNSMNGVCPFNFVYRYYSRDIAKIKSILFSANNACVVRVFYNKYKKSYHWLAVIGYDQKSGKIIGADPMDGQRVVIEDKYGKINGFAEVTRA